MTNSSLTVYRASAGSGKTFNLVLQYLLLSLNRPYEFKNILAITFTNKATEEFKRKLFKFLNDIANDSDDANTKSMIGELVKNGLKEKTIKQNSRLLLSLMLHNFSDISIMTIDAFLSRILKSFSLELNLNIGNEIEIDTGKVLDEIINDFLNELEEDTYETEILQKFLLKNISEGKARNIETNIISVSKEIFKDRYNLLYKNTDKDRDEKIYLEFIRSLESSKGQFENTLKSFCSQSVALMKSYNLRSSDFRYGFIQYIENILNASDRKDFKIADRFFNVLNEGGSKGWAAGKIDKSMIPEIEQCMNYGLLNKLYEIKDFYEQEYENYISVNLVLENIYSVALLKILKARLYDYQSSNNITLISELNNFISELIVGQDIPYLYEKAGLFYKYILIDEFQDTSRLQFTNLKPLVENSLSMGHNVFFVGDEKQSIYRFRDAFPETLIGIESEFDSPAIKDLANNFRSCENIINFNNEFFTEALTELNNAYIDKAYSKIKQVPQNKKGGYVSIEFIDNEKSRSPNKWKQNANKRLYEIITEQIELGYRYRDILILVDRNQDGLDIIKYLKGEMRKDGNHYEILSSDSLKLKYSPEIIFILSLITYLYDFSNNLAGYEIYNFYLSNIDPGKKQEMNLRYFSNDSLEDVLPKEFYEHRISYLKLPLVELVLKLVEIFNLYQYSGSFLSKFIDIVSDYSSKHGPDIKSFIKWWDDNSEDFSISVPDDLDAVEIMSIHRSKGLEREIVIIPYCEFSLKPNGNKDTLWANYNINEIELDVLIKATQDLPNSFFSDVYMKEANKIMLDNLNKLYVAFTRPKEKLFVFTKLPTKKEKAATAGTLLYNVIPSITFPLVENWNEEKNKFEFGDNNRNNSINSVSNNSINITDYKKTDWRKQVIIRNSVDVNLLLNENIQTGLIEGNIIHKIFSNMFFIEDLNEAINKVYFEGLISSGQINNLKCDISELLNIPEVNSWFTDKDATIYNEKEIVLSDGSIIRPDKIIINNGDVKLVEFKSTTLMLAEHKTQMQSYDEALKSMNFKKIEKYILYTRLKKVKAC